MDLPQPPADIELKNIIDKLAQFVARNGPEFEQMTKNKQKDNPKFSFLFGGELFNYYQYKVTTEQAILKIKGIQNSNNVNQQQQQALAPLPSMMGYGDNLKSNQHQAMTPIQIINAAANSAQWLMSHQQPPAPQPLPSAETEAALASMLEQQNVLQLQITQSEQNLAAQHAALMQSEETMIEEAIRKHQIEKITQKAVEMSINLNELDSVLQPIIDACTKDSISTGKAWILNHTAKGTHAIIAEHLLHKVIRPGIPFNQKLHVIYLVNDVMHHCVRKNATVLKSAVESVVVPMFCNSWMCGSADQQAKLSKLLNLWEAKNTYFSPEVIQRMKTPESSWKAYAADLLTAHDDIIQPVKLSTRTTYDGYRTQHDLFVNHAIIQIQTLEKEKMQLERKKQEQQQLEQLEQQRQQQDAQSQMMQMQNLPPPMISEDGPLPFDQPPPNMQPPFMPPPPDFSHLPPELLPDFSRPPPGFEPEPPIDDLIPSVPYYELPAGLMVSLIELDDFKYKPLNPAKLRLPPALPPSERLMQAVDAFYQKTYTGTRERLILDADGWEKLGLYEYYKAKNAARKKKEQEIEDGIRQKSKSPSPIRRERSRSRSPRKKRVYKSKSPSPEKEKTRSRSRSRSPPRRSNGTKSPRKSARSAPRRSRSRSKSESESDSDSSSSSSPPVRSPPSSRRVRSPPSARGDRSPPSERETRSPSSANNRRSPTPPSFGGGFAQTAEEKLDVSNKGHQMLMKMGWGGAGLGSKEQGIADPISGGDVRDRVDQYKGVGVNLHDPFESFRKHKGKAFITRMKARAEERAAE